MARAGAIETGCCEVPAIRTLTHSEASRLGVELAVRPAVEFMPDWTQREFGRLADIATGKLSAEYRAYVNEVPIEQRGASPPRTPDARNRIVSERQWKAEVHSWRQQLWAWYIAGTMALTWQEFLATVDAEPPPEEALTNAAKFLKENCGFPSPMAAAGTTQAVLSRYADFPTALTTRALVDRALKVLNAIHVKSLQQSTVPTLGSEANSDQDTRDHPWPPEWYEEDRVHDTATIETRDHDVSPELGIRSQPWDTDGAFSRGHEHRAKAPRIATRSSPSPSCAAAEDGLMELKPVYASQGGTRCDAAAPSTNDEPTRGTPAPPGTHEHPWSPVWYNSEEEPLPTGSLSRHPPCERCGQTASFLCPTCLVGVCLTCYDAGGRCCQPLLPLRNPEGETISLTPTEACGLATPASPVCDTGRTVVVSPAQVALDGPIEQDAAVMLGKVEQSPSGDSDAPEACKRKRAWSSAHAFPDSDPDSSSDSVREPAAAEAPPRGRR